MKLTFALLLSLASPSLASPQAPSDAAVRVDAFGYHPLSQKVVLLRSAVVGYDAPDGYAPGPLVEIRRSSDDSVAFAGAPATWNGGAVHGQSGDRAWHLDFSALQESGSFYAVDSATGARSEDFEIATDVYADVYAQALRSYYYQRCGTPKALPYAEPAWADGPCHLPDTAARSVLDPGNPATELDLSGGWHDAGDYNKYVNFTDDALHSLLSIYAAFPTHQRDDYGIPESGNGVPDLLDEVRWELEWLLRMQLGDGSVIHKLSVTDFAAASPPSADGALRYYSPPTASATASACAMFARAATAFGALGDAGSQAFAAQLDAGALAAWTWLDQNPSLIPSSYDNAGFQSADAEDPPKVQEMNRLIAAVYLYARTGASVYRNYVDSKYLSTDMMTSWWVAPWNHLEHEALLDYTQLAGATQVVVNAILDRFELVVSGPTHLGAAVGDEDPYGAPLPEQDHTWGSNRTKSLEGQILAAMNRYGLDAANAREYRAAAEGFLHYLHGVNPFGKAFLTNMGAHGAAGSSNEMYHSWFRDGSVWDSAETSLFGPAPGFLVGGPNPDYSPDAFGYSGPPISPPENQPTLKSFKDWNADWPENSWEVTENHNPYQAAYLRLLAEVALGTPVALGLEVTPVLIELQPATVTVGGAEPGSLVAVFFSGQLGSFDVPSALWCLALDIQVANPTSLLLFLGTADAGGVATWTVNVPTGLAGVALYFQATQASPCPLAVQSAVMPRTVR